MKLVSDFDGIWTNQNIEAEYVWKYIISSVSDLSGRTVNDVENFFKRCKDEMDKEPEKYGWESNKSVAAFYGEDPFGDNNAIFGFIDQASENFEHTTFREELIQIKKSILNKFKSLSEYSQECFMIATTRFKSEGKLKPLESTADTVKKIKSLNTDIVIVSNSNTEKIKYLFSQAGIKVTGDNAAERESVHARGDAKKYIINNSDTYIKETLEINSRIKVPLRRSSYYFILNEEKPDFVIGDVFSLDIALPFYLRQNDKNFSKLKVIQRVQKYTPDWVKDYLSSKELEGIAYMVESVEEVPGIIAKYNESLN